MNRTEAAFFEWLKAGAIGPDGEAVECAMREGITLKLGNGVRYTPDFTAWSEEDPSPARMGWLQCYEVKGFMRDDAAVKIKVAAALFPFFRFYLVKQKTKKQGGGWSIERVLP